MAKAPPTPTMDARQATAIAKRADATPAELAAAAGVSTTVDRLLARHANAPADLLEKLSRSGDKTTRKCVAIHPNAPRSVLLSLATQFPADFYRNPAFDWLLLEEPDLLFKLGHGVLKNILKRPDCPRSLQAWAVEHGDEQQKLAVAMNPEALEDLLQKLVAQGGEPGVAAVGHVKLSGVGDLAQAELAFRDGVAQTLARLSVSDAKALWRRGCIGPAHWLWLSPDTRLAVPGRDGPTDPVCDFDTEPDDEAAARDEDPGIRAVVAGMQDKPSRVLELLATDPDAWVRRRVAGNAVTPSHLLEALSLDVEGRVRHDVAANPSTPLAVLRALAADPETWPRMGVASNRDAPPDLLVSLSADTEQSVRVATAGNSATPAAALEALGEDPSDRVRQAVGANPSTPLATLNKLALDTEIDTRAAVAKNSAAPAELLEALSLDAAEHRHYGPVVRVAVAANRSASPTLLQKLALDETRCLFGAVVRQAVAANPSTPPSVLLGLSTDKNKRVLAAVAGNVSSPAQVLETLAGIQNLGARARAALAKNPSTPISVLSRLARIKDAKVMEGLAANPACPQSLVRWSAALRWRHDLIKLAKTLPAGATDRLPDLPQDESIVEIFRVECQRVVASPLQSIVANLILASDDQLLALSPEHSRSACRSSSEAVRLRGLRHRRADPIVLVKKHQSTDWRERLAIAGNPAASLSVLEALSRDAHRLVAVQAAAAIRIKDEQLKARTALIAAAPSRPDCRALAAEVCQRLRDLDLSEVGPIGGPWWRRLQIDQRNGGDWKYFSWIGQARGIPLTSQDQLRLVCALAADPKAEWWNDFPDAPSLTSTAALETLAKCPREEIRHSVAVREHAPGQVLKLLAKDKSRHVRLATAGNPSTPPDALTALARLTDPGIRCAVAGNPSAPLHVLERLAADADTGVCMAVAANAALAPALQLEILNRMASGSDSWRVSLVAKSPALPAVTRNTLFQRLALDEDERARGYAAENPATPPALLEALSLDPVARVRICAAGNQSLPAESLLRLSRDDSVEVRKAVAGNPSTPEAAFMALVEDRDRSVLTSLASNQSAGIPFREAALMKLARFEDDSRNYEGEYARRTAAAHQLTPPATLTTLAGDKDLEVVMAVARNKATPAATRATALERLASFPDSWGGRVAAGHPETPLPVLHQLAQSEDTAVLVELVENRAAPLALRATLAEALCRDAALEVRRAMAESDATPERLLVEMAQRDFWIVRLAAVNNPSFPSDRRQAALDALTEEVRSALEPLQPFAFDEVSPEDFAAPFAVLGLMPDPGDREAIAKAAKAKDWVRRAAACLSDGVTIGELNRLVDDEVEMVSQLAISRLHDLQAQSAREVSA